MAIDPGELPRVAWFFALVALGACGPRVRPDVPFPEEPIARRERAPVPARLGRQVIVGELCPRGAAGRPAVAPLLMRTLQWTDAPAEVGNAVERGSAPRFVAFGVDGKLAGLFDTLGLAEVSLGQSVASGTYVGGAPCSSDAGSGQRTDDPACAAATNGCGLAVAEIARPDDPPQTPAYQVGGACLAGDALVVDIDGDGVVEAFPLSGILDSIRGPAQEWSASRNARPGCAPRFVLYDVRLMPEAEPGKSPDPRAVVMLDLLGVVDLDGDGRKELVVALRFPTVRTVVAYSANSSPERLELVGEAQSFQK
ncbi:MAG TPA: hypothetical protein VHN14_19950 [Kofleriaceae bacterium]|nr:hypothetical protein [Kofleriaceae bacterium]